MATENTARLAVLIDADNAQSSMPFVAACDKSNITVSQIETAGQGSATGA